MLSSYERNARKKVATIAASVIIIALIVVVTDHRKSENGATANTGVPSASAPATATPTTPVPTSAGSTASAGYKDGTYSASSSYNVPHGNEDIQVSLTIKNGVVTDSSLQNSQGNRESAAYQEDFASSYKSSVVGKSLSGLQIDVIAGASDTTQGFNDALGQIAAKAKA